MSFTSRSVLPSAWGVCLILLVCALLWRASGTPWLRSNIFELLPPAEYDAITANAVAAAERELSSRVFFLVGHRDRAVAESAADRLAAGLADNDLIATVDARVAPQTTAAFAEFYYKYRRQLLTEAQLAAIDADAGRAIEERALAGLYGPLGAVNSASLLSDPFGLFAESMQGLQTPRNALTFSAGYLWAVDQGTSYAFIAAQTVSASLDMGSQSLLVDEIGELTRQILATDEGLRVLKTGFLFYADAGTRSARGEISTIGIGSLLGVIVLIVSLFRSVRPLALALLSIAAGCLLAITVTVWSFGSIHLFTLVFGASLIGVSIDYTFHYLAEEFVGAREAGLRHSLRQVFPGITLGLITSVVAYLALTVAPFPGLKQLAIFSAAGLIGAYLTLLCCAGWFGFASGCARQPVLLRASAAYLEFWRRLSRRGQWAIAGSLAVIALAGIFALEVDDDIGLLQAQPQDLRREEAELARLTAATPSNTFLLLRAATDELLLQHEEAVRGRLDQLILAGDLSGYIAISQRVPSAARQRRSVEAYEALVRARLPGFLAGLGVADQAATAAVVDLTRAAEPIGIRIWLDDPVSARLRSLWLGPVNESFASIILLEGATDVVLLSQAMAGFEGVTVVDKARDLSALLGLYRVRVTWLIIAGYVAILVLLAVRYGIFRSSILLIPPVLAGIVALGLTSLFGATLNLFNLLALILVLGIGIDFTIFIAEARGELKATLLAITLSALTTVLSFGLLSLSATYAVQSFGATVLIGITCSYLLAPMALSARVRV